MLGSEVSSENDLVQLTDLFRLLSDKTRLHILMLLSQGERNVSAMCDELKLPQPTVSHHLGLLRMNNIIANRRSGKQIIYALNGRVAIRPDGSVRIDSDRYSVTIAADATGASEGQHTAN